MNKYLSFFVIAAALTMAACNSEATADNHSTTSTRPDSSVKKDTAASSAQPAGAIADAATIMARKQIPVLCYHHIKDVPPSALSKYGYDVTVKQFKEQLKMLSDSGYHAILPEQHYNYLAYGTPLPEKPFMLTYDDTDEEQFSVAKPEMDKYGFKGVYFIMTISIGRPRYMTKEQIRQLADEGHAVECHTWDHHRADRYLKEDRMIQVGGRQVLTNDWDIQLADTKKKIEAISGKPVNYFAYPFGLWSKEGIPEIQKRGYKMAYILSTKRDSLQPMHTVRRIIVDPHWSSEGLLRVMRTSFP